MGNLHSRGQQRDKPFRDALRLEIAAAEGKAHSLRKIAYGLLVKAAQGSESAIQQVADRIDGKPVQALVGDNEHDPISVQEVTNEDRARAVAMLVKKVRDRK